jgi:hypothetical protein
MGMGISDWGIDVRRTLKKDLEETQQKLINLHSDLILTVLAGAGYEVDPHIKTLIGEVYKSVSKLDGSEEALRNAGPEKIAEVNAKMRSAPFELRRMLKHGYKQLPHSPGGRSRAIPDEKQQVVINHIVELIRYGMEPREAKAAAARRYGVSLSTIQRVWRHRKTGSPDNSDAVDM